MRLAKFFLTDQGVRQHRQIIGLIAIAFARGARLPLGRLGIPFPQIHFGKTRMQNRILWRVANRVAQRDFCGLQISFFEILFCLLDGGGRVFGVRGAPDERSKSAGNYAAPPIAPFITRNWLSFLLQAAIPCPNPNLGRLRQVVKRMP